MANTGIPVAAEDTSNNGVISEPRPTGRAAGVVVPSINSELPAALPMSLTAEHNPTGTATSMTTGACTITRPLITMHD